MPFFKIAQPFFGISRQRLAQSFTAGFNYPIPVYSACKSWTQLLKVRCCIRHCHTASLRNVHTVKLQNLKHIGIRILPHGLAAVTGLGLGTYLLSKNSLVECKVKHREKNRLVGQTEESKKPDVDFEWKQFFQILWPDIYSLALAIVCALATAVVNIKLPLMVGEVVNVVSQFTKDSGKDFIEEIKKPAMRLIVTYLIQGGLTVAYISLLSNIGENLAARLRTSLFSSLLKQDIEFFDRHKTGELIDRLTSDVQDFKSSFKLCVSQGLRAITQVCKFDDINVSLFSL